MEIPRVRARARERKVVGVRDEAEAAEIRVEAGRRVGEPAAGCLGAMVREAKESLPVEVVLTQHRVGIHARVYRRDASPAQPRRGRAGRCSR